MKILVGFARIFVGVLFIFSGFIKLNDPLGFAYKLEEYFGADVLNLEFLIPYALVLSIFLVITEVLLGIMLLIGYARKFTLWSLLIMILFFTFLTFYSAYFNKVTDCGCFGDAIPLVPWESFIKDVILLVLILLLFFQREKIKPIFSTAHKWIVFVSFIGCLIFGYYVLMHLPVFDFRAYQEGYNIKEKMTVPEDAPKDIFEYQWKFSVNGEEKVYTTNGIYPSVDGDFIGVDTKRIQEGYVPPIHDFTMEKNGEDHTEKFLEIEKLIIVVAYSLEKSETDGFSEVKKVTDEAKQKGYTVIGLSASSEEVVGEFKEKYNLDFEFYFSDATTLKTIIRSNPGIVKLNNGTIIQKLHWNDAEDIEL